VNYLSRLLIIIVGYVVSCAVAGLLLSMAWATQENAVDGGTLYRILARMVTFGGFAAAGSLLIIPVVGYAEYAAERRYAFYAVCGVLAGLLPGLIAEPAQLTSARGVAGLALFSGIGLAAATVYWLIAGRNAGFPKSAATG
jgi:hypothetical protein